MNNKFFPNVKEKFGFGCMRLPMNGEAIDIEQFKAMVDRFIEAGFNYFDTAHGYHRGLSELAIKEALTSRYNRDQYILTDKLTDFFFEKREDIRPFFESQLKACGVEYFDYYLMHAQNRDNYKKFMACHAYEEALKLKEEGKIKHLGISFHDDHEILEMILNEHPEIEVVQIQYNYLDYDNPRIQSGKLASILEERNIPIIVMEPVKGGSLVNLPTKAKEVFDKLDGGSYASYALRFAGQREGMFMVLSGMSDINQLEDNISFMKDIKPLSSREMEAVKEVISIYKNQRVIQCTSCRYCTAGCPMDIPIPDLFFIYNNSLMFNDWRTPFYYRTTIENKGAPGDCIKCGQCESACPQKLPIRDLLVTIKEKFE